MKRITVLLFLYLFIAGIQGLVQSNPVIEIFPEGTVLYGNIAYNNDTLQKHLLDIYLPADATGKVPLVIWAI
jgi:spore germination protein GerM